MEWRIGGMKQGKGASLIIEQEILNPKSEWKDKGKKKNFPGWSLICKKTYGS